MKITFAFDPTVWMVGFRLVVNEDQRCLVIAPLPCIGIVLDFTPAED